MNHTVRIYLFEKPYDVPDDMTIMRAMEYAGYRPVEGCGCRGGSCGACTVFYRIGSEKKIHAALACERTVCDGMIISSFPIPSPEKRIYDIEEIRPGRGLIPKIFPEATRCRLCGLCNTACPNGLSVMAFVQAALQGDFSTAAELSFGCIACNACTVVCPSGIPQPQVALLSRRINGKYLQPRDESLDRLAEAIRCGAYEEQLRQVFDMPTEALHLAYQNREFGKYTEQKPDTKEKK